MLIQRAPQGGQPRRPQSNTPQPTPPPPPPEGHHHGLSGTLLHVGHDAAMLAMTPASGQHDHGQHSLPPGVNESDICRGSASPTPAVPHDHSHHDHAHHQHNDHHHHAGAQSGSNWLATGSAVVSGLVAVGAAVHGAQMITSKDRFTQLEGANHLLMSASCGVMAAGMLAPQLGVGSASTPLMAAHGLGELALGAYQLIKGTREDCQHHQLAGILKLAHGGCLAAAQFFPGAAFPLYLGMTAATASQVALQQAGLSH